MQRVVAVIVILFVSTAIVVGQYTQSEWQRLDRANSQQLFNFTLSLKLENLETLKQLHQRLTTPGSAEYRQWKSVHELNAITQPNPHKVQQLLHWLSLHNLHPEHFGDFIKVSGMVRDVESAFYVEIYEFQHIERLDFIIQRASSPPNTPSEFIDIVEFHTGISNFPGVQSESSKSPQFEIGVDKYYMIPRTLQEQYNIPTDYIASNPLSSQAIANFNANNGISTSDLQEFMAETGGILQNVTLSYTVGTFYDKFVTSEPTLDVQYITGIAPGVATAFYNTEGWVYDFTTLILQRAYENQTLPLIFSMSYGSYEKDQCLVADNIAYFYNGTTCDAIGGSSATYIEMTDVGFMKIGLLGISIFVSSGDAGAGSGCDLNAPNVVYPASSPYVTAVGGTMYSSASVLDMNPMPPFCARKLKICAGTGVEVVCTKPESFITSGGGFSNYTTMPSYQTSVVPAYVSSATYLPPSNQFNSSNRAIPDISALAHRYMIVQNGRASYIDGTSASSPAVAGIFALINDNLLNAGKPPIGFLNPTLYHLASISNNIIFDITSGNNSVSDTVNGQDCLGYGYGASPGWDAATGFGSINYPQMLSAFLNL